MKLYISALQKLVHSGDSCNDVGRPFDVLTVHRANDQKLCALHIFVFTHFLIYTYILLIPYIVLYIVVHEQLIPHNCETRNT